MRPEQVTLWRRVFLSWVVSTATLSAVYAAPKKNPAFLPPPTLLERTLNEMLHAPEQPFTGMDTFFDDDEPLMGLQNSVRSNSPLWSLENKPVMPTQTDQLFEEGVAREEAFFAALPQPGPSATDLEAIEGLKHLAISFEPVYTQKAVYLRQFRTAEEVATEVNNRFFSSQHRTPIFGDYNDQALEQRLRAAAQIEELPPRIQWKRGPIDLGASQRRLNKNIEMLSSRHALVQLQSFLPLAEKSNQRASRNFVRNALKPVPPGSSSVLGTPHYYCLILTSDSESSPSKKFVLLNAESLQHVKIDPFTGKLNYRHPKSGEGGPIELDRIARVPVTRFWKNGKRVPLIKVQEGKRYPFSEIDMEHVFLKRAILQNEDPLWKLRPPTEILQVALQQRQAHNVRRIFSELRGTLSGVEYQGARTQEKWRSLIAERVSRSLYLPEVLDASSLSVYTHHNRQPLSLDNLDDLVAKRFYIYFPEVFPTNPTNSLWRALLWSRLEGENSWADREARARAQGRPPLEQAVRTSNKIETLRNFFHNMPRAAWQKSKKPVSWAAALLMFGVSTTALYKGAKEFASDDNFVSEAPPGVVRQAVIDFAHKLRALLPAGSMEDSPSHPFASMTGEMGDPQGSGFDRISEDKVLYRVNGDQSRNILRMAKLGELRSASMIMLPSSGTSTFSLKSEIPIRPTEGFISLPSDDQRMLTHVELREVNGTLIDPEKYTLLRHDASRTYGIDLKGSNQRVMIDYAFGKTIPESRLSADFERVIFDISKQRLREIHDLLNEAGFQALAAELQKLIERPGKVSAEDLRKVTSQTAVYSHARVEKPELTIEELERNPFLQFKNFLLDGVICGECDAGNPVLALIHQMAFRDNPRMESGLRVSYISEEGQVREPGHVENELMYGREVLRLDGTPLLRPNDQQAKKLIARDQVAGRHTTNGPDTDSDDSKSPDRKPENKNARGPFPVIDRQRKEDLFHKSETDRRERTEFVPSDPPAMGRNSSESAEAAESVQTDGVKNVDAESVERVQPDAYEAKIPLPPPPRVDLEEERWRKSWIKPLEEEFSVIKRLNHEENLNFHKTPILKPVIQMLGLMSGYANGRISLIALHESVLKTPFQNPKSTLSELKDELRNRMEGARKSLSRNQKSKRLSTQESMAEDLINHVLNKTTHRLREMFHSLPPLLEECSDYLRWVAPKQ